MAIAIKIENLSKQYRLGLVSTRTLSHDLNRWWQTSILGKEDPYLKIGQENKLASHNSSLTTHHAPEYVWALKDINLQVEEGEVLGIIGKNGAGKSTLLKILSKVTAPTTGIVKARGRIASLLEVGTGFHPEMTGRENIYMNGSIMGMTKAEITRKFDEIVDFAGVAKYIDTPVKRYSSGMTVRLGFAIAAHLEPEILVVDEVLAVGDAEFQKKAVGKMQDISKGEGRTVLFVSHNMASILNLCQTCILLNSGMVETRGESSEVINHYLMKNSQNSSMKTQGIFDLSDRKNPYGKNLIIKKVTLRNSKGILTESFTIGEKMQILIDVENFNNYPGALIGVIFNSPEGQRLTSINTGMVKPQFMHERKDYEQVMLEIPRILLTENRYIVDISIALQGVGRLDYIENQVEIEIVDSNFYNEGYKVTKHNGYFCLEGKWSVS